MTAIYLFKKFGSFKGFSLRKSNFSLPMMLARRCPALTVLAPCALEIAVVDFMSSTMNISSAFAEYDERKWSVKVRKESQGWGGWCSTYPSERELPARSFPLPRQPAWASWSARLWDSSWAPCCLLAGFTLSVWFFWTRACFQEWRDHYSTDTGQTFCPWSSFCFSVVVSALM